MINHQCKAKCENMGAFLAADEQEDVRKALGRHMNSRE